uniref:EF-hand domain-containing protein n=1 Tax=Mantoniella antarctica TaxID=81844 RepID=A0A7S0XA11_9CHLO
MAESGHLYTPIRTYPYEPRTPLSRSIVSTPASIQNHASFIKYESKRIVVEPVDLDDLAKYVQELRPRCIHDFKPMCYLLQSLMGHLLAREIDFFSVEIRGLRNDLLRMQGLLNNAVERDKMSQDKSIFNRFKEAVTVSTSASNMESHSTYLVTLSEQQASTIQALQAKLAASEANAKALAFEAQAAQAAQLRAQAKEALQEQALHEKSALINVLKQKDTKILELQRKLDQITAADDTAAQIAALSSQVAELKRQLAEGGGVAVENGDYEAYARSLGADAPGDIASKTKKLGRLSPAEAARVLQAMGSWVDAGAILCGNTVDFISDVLTCEVLDHTDVGHALHNLGRIDGMVLFAMSRKTTADNIVGPMRTVHPAVAGGWLTSAAVQAKTRLSAIGHELGAEAIVEVVRTLGDGDAEMVFDSQPPHVLAAVCDAMYRGNELSDAVDTLLRCSGNTRTATLDAMDEDLRKVFQAAMAHTDEGGGSFTCYKCGAVNPAADDADADAEGSVKQTPVSDDTSARGVEHMRPPQCWLTFCDARSNGRLKKQWDKDGRTIISPIKLRSMVTTIYHNKLKSDVALVREGKHRYPLAEYVAQWFDNTYGLGKLAQQKMVRFIFSLQKMYEEMNDRRVCQFVRMCGLFHPLPAVTCDLLLECLEIISGCMSGSGEMFRSDTEFWSTWKSGKMVAISKEKQLLIMKQVFGPKQDATAVRARLSQELLDNPEVVPSYVTLPAGNVSLSRFASFTLEIMHDMSVESRSSAMELFRAAAGSDSAVSFTEFKHACLAMQPLCSPSEGSFAFMYWQAATTGKNPSTKATMDAVKKWEATLDSIGGSKAAVQVEDAVGSFLWHCGIFNVLGMQADGSSKLEKHRQQAMKVKTTCSVGF